MFRKFLIGHYFFLGNKVYKEMSIVLQSMGYFCINKVFEIVGKTLFFKKSFQKQFPSSQEGTGPIQHGILQLR